jgi:hydrogenase nickel incorporation protein HypA/HybF
MPVRPWPLLCFAAESSRVGEAIGVELPSTWPPPCNIETSNGAGRAGAGEGTCAGFGGEDVHELSIAVSLVDAVCEQLPALGEGARVTAVHVRVGALAGVIPESLIFSFDVASADTPIAGARLAIEAIPIVAWCDRCGAERAVRSPQRLQCPECATPTPRLVAGRELELAAVEVVDDAANR